MADQALMSGVSYCRQAMSLHPRKSAQAPVPPGATAACSGRTVACPHAVHALQVVKLWREDLASINAKAAESLADPAQYPNLFPNLDLALHAEQYQVWCRTLTCPGSPCFLFNLAVCDLVLRGSCLNMRSVPSVHTSGMA